MASETATVARDTRGFAGLGDRLLVVFDGRCGFCNWSIRWFLVRDVFDRLRFAASELPAVAGVLERHGVHAASPSSIVVVRGAGEPSERVFVGSAAVIEMLSKLPRPWRMVGSWLSAVPRPIREFGYYVVAGLRYRLAGRYASCPIPTVEERGHFYTADQDLTAEA